MIINMLKYDETRSCSDIPYREFFSWTRAKFIDKARKRERNREKERDKFPLETCGDPAVSLFERANEQPRTSDNDSPQKREEKVQTTCQLFA